MAGAPMEDMAGVLPGLKIAPTFLRDFKQAHPSPMSAWGDVVDNCRDAKATRLDIDVRSVNAAAAAAGEREPVLVVLTDDGSGMLEDDMAKGISGLGYTDKGLETGEHHRLRPVRPQPSALTVTRTQANTTASERRRACRGSPTPASSSRRGRASTGANPDPKPDH